MTRGHRRNISALDYTQHFFAASGERPGFAQWSKSMSIPVRSYKSVSRTSGDGRHCLVVIYRVSGTFFCYTFLGAIVIHC
jgi:hypothetical protein